MKFSPEHTAASLFGLKSELFAEKVRTEVVTVRFTECEGSVIKLERKLFQN